MYRRLRWDMIKVYKILHHNYDPRVVVEGLLILSEETRTRGHSLKMAKRSTRLDIRKHFFSERVIIPWNSLTDEVIPAPSVRIFESRFDRLWQHKHSGSIRMLSSKIKRNKMEVKDNWRRIKVWTKRLQPGSSNFHSCQKWDTQKDTRQSLLRKYQQQIGMHFFKAMQSNNGKSFMGLWSN